MEQPTLGTMIRQARQRRGWTQEELGTQVHRSKSFISDIEADRHYPSYATLRALSSALRLDAVMLRQMKDSSKLRA